MYNFKKIFGLAGAVVVFTGLASAQQVNCNTTNSAPTANAFLIRAEGTTEQVADLTLTCTNTGAAVTPAASSVNIQVFLSAPVTSKTLTTGSTSASEALALVNSPAGSNPAVAAEVQGTVSGSSIQFNNVPVPPGLPGGSVVGSSFTVTITNVRVNASTVAVGSGAPPAVTESAFVSGAGAIAAATNPVQVAFVTPGLTGVKSNKSFAAGAANATAGANNMGNNIANAFTSSSGGTNNFVICTAINAAGATNLNVIQITEGFAAAFKGQGSAGATNNTVGAEFTNNTETGFVPQNGFPTAGAAGSNVANSGTRIKIVFANVPTGLTLYVPTTVSSTIPTATGAAAPAVNPASTFMLTSSETGAFSAVAAASTGSNVGANLGAITPSGGAATAVYEFFPAANASSFTESFNFPVQAVYSSNGIAASTTAVTETVSFAPTGSTNIPNFVVGSSSTTLTSSTFNLCTTSLLFPFVTNQLGFDTGIAISNTSTDPFGSNGAAPQAGTCTLNFYGDGAPSPANITTPNVASGKVFTQVLSGVAAGFQGYMIAQCQFQFAHGFAFITDGVGTNGGLSQGYLAGVIPDVNQKKRAADPLSIAVAGTGETLGN